MEDKLGLMLTMQQQLQRESMKDGDPGSLKGDAMADFMRWNAWALVTELGEAFQEVGWKPWGTNRQIDYDKFMREMVDAWHFFMNLLLCASEEMTPHEIADEFTKRYIEKNALNAQRQAEGYDGRLEKCTECGRERGQCDHE